MVAGAGVDPASSSGYEPEWAAEPPCIAYLALLLWNFNTLHTAIDMVKLTSGRVGGV